MPGSDPHHHASALHQLGSRRSGGRHGRVDDVRIPYRDICFLGAKPQVEADVYIDDAPHNVDGLRAADNDVIVFDAPYNQGLAGPRASTWQEVEAIVIELAAAKGAIQPQLPGIDPGADRLERRKRPQ
ncbi:MAG: hypothetical protein R2710_16260 [Acidimicrobiales bacterium]